MVHSMRYLQAQERKAETALERVLKTLANTWDPDQRALAKKAFRRAKVRLQNASLRLDRALLA